MKRLACLLLVLILIPVCSSASQVTDFDLDEYNRCAAVFLASPMVFKHTENGMDFFMAEGCAVAYSHDGNKMQFGITGSNVRFISYALAAVMYVSKERDFSRNAGLFLEAYLDCVNGLKEDAILAFPTGEAVNVSRYDDGYMVLIGRW